MSLLPFLAVTMVGAVIAFLVRGSERLASTIGAAGLLGAVIAAVGIQPGETVLLGGSGLATTEYLRLFLIVGSLLGLLLAVVGAATTRHRDAPTVTLGILATSALALALPDPRLAIVAATAGGAFGALLTLDAAGARAGATVGIRVLRATTVAGMLAVAAIAWLGRDLSELAARPVVFGLAFLAVALATAIRFGVIPFHAWAARLTDTTPETTLPLVTALAPAAFAIVALAWADASVAPLLVDLDAVRAVVVAIGVASILLASLAAWIQDDVEHVVGYSIVGDAGVVLLAVAALDPEVWAPARTWILAFIVARSAFAAWAAAVRTTFATGRIADLRGWVAEAPLLATAFVLVVAASVGLPGLAAFEARAALVEHALDGPLVALVLLGTLSPLAYYGRLLAIGLARPALDRGDGHERPSGGRWPRLEPLDLTDLPGWARRAWAADRMVVATAGALALALFSVIMSVGGFGAPEAAAGLPPSLKGASESFTPEGPLAPDPSFEPEPSFEPVPTP